MAWRKAAALILALGACTPTNIEKPPPFDPAAYPAIRLAVGSVEVANAAQYPADMGFIARRRSELLAQDAMTFLNARLIGAGGSDFAKATVEEASIVEQPRPTGEGVIAEATQPNWEMVGILGLKVAIIDGLGIEQGFATSRVEIKRTLSQRAGVEAKDDFARQLINDLIAASSTELEESINQNLADRKAP